MFQHFRNFQMSQNIALATRRAKSVSTGLFGSESYPVEERGSARFAGSDREFGGGVLRKSGPFLV